MIRVIDTLKPFVKMLAVAKPNGAGSDRSPDCVARDLGSAAVATGRSLVR
jgi:hypothetical protein